MTVHYVVPRAWIAYDRLAIVTELVEAKTAIASLTTIPYERRWLEKLQQIQLKMEVAATSRIEGADFTENELDAALDPRTTPQDLVTRSQRQARAAVNTYRWISTLPQDRTIDSELVREVHARMVTGCDDDHCPPGILRKADENVTFGTPRHRGCEGGALCQTAFAELMKSVGQEFQAHDSLIQALALHYHLAAMHPFLDGNGRTARALEALLLQRAGLKDVAFIAVSNYYYDEKAEYLRSLAAAGAGGHDLTPFFKFGLRGIASQCRRLATEVRKNMAKALFRNMMYDLFNRLQTKRSRVIRSRQIEILKILLEVDEITAALLFARILPNYKNVRNQTKAMLRDIHNLINLGAIRVDHTDPEAIRIASRLEWPSEITESEFFKKIREMPKGRTFRFLP